MRAGCPRSQALRLEEGGELLEADEGEEGPDSKDDGDGAGQAVAIAVVGSFEIVEGVVDAG